MKIHFVTEGSIDAYWEGGKKAACDLLLFGFEGLGEVDYRRELAGESEKLADMAILSREAGCTVVAGGVTLSCGARYKSAAVAEKGRILGVADMLYVEEGQLYRGGAHLKVFDTAAGKIGVCVGEDLFYPSLAEAFSLCDADLIVSIFGGAEDFAPQLMLRACSFTAGVPACMCAAGIAQAAEPSGDIALRAARRECSYSLEYAREYSLVTLRARGRHRKQRGDY